MKNIRQIVFAGIAAGGLGMSSAAAQTLSDARPAVKGQEVAQAAFNAERQCHDTINSTVLNTVPCVEAIETAIRALASYQLDSSTGRNNVYLYENFGVIGAETRVRPGERERMGREAMVDSVYADISQTLDLSVDVTGMEAAVISADQALKSIFVYAANDSLGVHPDGKAIGKVVIALAHRLQVEQSGRGMERQGVEIIRAPL